MATAGTPLAGVDVSANRDLPSGGCRGADGKGGHLAQRAAAPGWHLVARTTVPGCRRIAAVPSDATPEHPAITALLDLVRSLDVPWWVPALSGAIYLRLGCHSEGRAWSAAEGLASLRALCEINDWGTEPEWAHAPLEPRDGSSGNGHVRFGT